MTHPDEWRDAADPGQLFLKIWSYVNGVTRTRLAAPESIPRELCGELRSALEEPGGVEAVRAFCAVLAARWNSATDWRARRSRVSAALAALRVIDEILLVLHPRSIRTSLAIAPSRPDWLADVEEHRTLTGTYARQGSLALIAKGPLMRCPKMPEDQATFSLGDQFAALKVVNLDAFAEDGRKIDVSVTVIDQSADAGVPHRRDRKASEVVTFAPLAEKEDDLKPEVIRDGATVYLDILKGSTFDPTSAFLGVVEANSESDIVLAPELAIDDDDLSRISKLLSGLSGARPRLLVAGSGLTGGEETEGGLPFNRAAALNGNGRILWTHRKVSAYAMHEETAKDLKISGADGADKLMERISWSDAINIVDLDGLGRCMMLICQDLQMPVVGQLLEAFRPDWVIVPILDTGTSLVRWPAKRARDLATISEARFVVVSSLTMKAWQTKPFPGEVMGIAIGPTYLNQTEAGDTAAIEAEVSPETATRRFGSVRWRNATGWRRYR